MLINNKYKIEQELGRGGMGTVYRAFDIETNTIVAVKETIILPSEDEHRKLKRLQREYNFLKSIHHSNIVRAIDFFEYQNTYYIVMEYVDGYSLESLIQEKPYSLTVEEQLEIVLQICDAIATLNEKGVIHRDLKPANIILCKYRRIPKVLDLGIAKDVQKTMTMLTRPGYVIGTFSYMSPEQFNAEASNKSDAFSLGVMFYQFFLWLPQSPYYAKGISEALDKINNTKLSPLVLCTKNPHEFHATISEIIDLALLHDIEKRISVREMQRRFAAILGKEIKPPTKNLDTKADHKKITSRTRRLDAVKKRQTSRLPKSQSKNQAMLKMPNFTFSLNDTIIRTAYTIIILTLVYFMWDLYKATVEQEDYFRLGQTALSSKRYYAAIRFYSFALQQDPQNAIAYLGKGKSHFYCKNYQEALLCFQQALQIKKSSELLYHRGCTYQAMKQYEKAISDFQHAIKLDIRNTGAYKELAITYAKQGKYQKATDVYTQGLVTFPQSFVFVIDRGVYFEKQKKYVQALNDFLKATTLRTKDTLGYRNSAIILNRLGKYKKALTYITTAIDLDKNDITLRAIRIDSAEALENWQILEEDYSYLLQVSPTMQYYASRAYVYQKLKKYTQAAADYTKAIELQSSPSHLLYWLRGLNYHTNKQYKQAIQDYRKVVKLEPEYVDAYKNLSYCYQALGNQNQAVYYQALWKVKKKKDN